MAERISVKYISSFSGRDCQIFPDFYYSLFLLVYSRRLSALCLFLTVFQNFATNFCNFFLRLKFCKMFTCRFASDRRIFLSHIFLAPIFFYTKSPLHENSYGKFRSHHHCAFAFRDLVIMKTTSGLLPQTWMLMPNLTIVVHMKSPPGNPGSFSLVVNGAPF